MDGNSSSAEDSEADFHNELEAKLQQMGVKRKREAPVGSNRVIQPAKRSRKDGGKGTTKATAKTKANTKATTKKASTSAKEPLFNAPDSEDDDEAVNDVPEVPKPKAKRPQPRRKVSKPVEPIPEQDDDDKDEDYIE